METFDLLIAAVGATGLSAATVGVCHWWYGRRLAALADRLDKVDKARQFAQQQTLQARKQIEKLQKDMAAQHKAPAPAEAAPRQRQPDTAAKSNAEMVAMLAAGDQRSHLPVDGFADTQPATQGCTHTQTMPRHGFADTQAAPRHGFADTQAVPRPRAY